MDIHNWGELGNIGLLRKEWDQDNTYSLQLPKYKAKGLLFYKDLIFLVDGPVPVLQAQTDSAVLSPW